MTAPLGLAQSTSQHLACLKDYGMVTAPAQGRASVFSLTHPEALADLFTAAERLLELTGETSTLSPNFGAPGLERTR